MTKVVIRGGGYTDASDHLASANWWAAVHVDALSDVLAGSGAMAGDSSFAGEFAAAYDEAATATLAAADDVVGGLAGLCRITYCSYENHVRAEESSYAPTDAVSTEPGARANLLYAAASPPPPSSLGGDASFLPGWANVILDHVEGFVWPDADVDRLRTTAAAWRSAASGLEAVGERTGSAINALLQEHSPEILPAAAAIGDLRGSIDDVAAVCAQLATACDDYATQVETQRELILDLVRDLIRDAVLIAAAGFVLGLVTGGSTNAVAAWINSGKLASQVPVFKSFVEALRLWGASAATGLRTGTETIMRTKATLRRMIQARKRISGVERGSISLGKQMTWLRRHEGGPMGAHTMERHVGKSNRFLRRRLAEWPKIKEASTFTDQYVAEDSIKRVLAHYSQDLRDWLAGKGPLIFKRDLDLEVPVGRIMARDGSTRPGQVVRIVLQRDASMPDGFRLYTSYLIG